MDTFAKIDATNNEHQFDLYLGGSIYEPRKSYFDSVNSLLSKSGIRIQQTPKNSDNYIDYLLDLRKSRMVLSTNFLQIPGSQKLHLLGKSIETLHVGSLLLTQSTSALTNNFVEYEDFVPVADPMDAVEKINYYHYHETERAKISLSGFLKAKQLVTNKHFMSQIDCALESHKLRRLKS
jgi:hypothetical protein